MLKKIRQQGIRIHFVHAIRSSVAFHLPVCKIKVRRRKYAPQHRCSSVKCTSMRVFSVTPNASMRFVISAGFRPDLLTVAIFLYFLLSSLHKVASLSSPFDKFQPFILCKSPVSCFLSLRGLVSVLLLLLLTSPGKLYSELLDMPYARP
jgi:hypothetical protein